MNGIPLESVSHHPYLRIELSSNLNWSFHIENIIGKANRSLGFIRRNLYSCPESVKSQAYLTLVRPCLEYVCSVWDPHTQKRCQDIEGVQRRAARSVKKLLCARTRYSYKPPERSELALIRTETQNSETYYHYIWSLYMVLVYLARY